MSWRRGENLSGTVGETSAGRKQDCMILGRSSVGNDQAVIIELKQWEECKEG
jgi:hypothetical protein